MNTLGYLHYLFLMLLFFYSCQSGIKREAKVPVVTKVLTKLERLSLLPVDSVMDAYDLSNDNIADFPDLSAFAIRSLDLSYNLLDTINPNFLPKGLEKLNLSYNLYCGFVGIEEGKAPFLKELDISHNAVNRIYIGVPLYRIIVSYNALNNDLNCLHFDHGNIQYLDVSYNSDMPQRVGFEPAWIDTIVSEGVADGKPLLGAFVGVRVY